MMKHILMLLDITTGELRFKYPIVTTVRLSDQQTIEGYAEQYASEFYGSDATINDGWYCFYGDSVRVKVFKATELTKEHYDIVRTYLY